MAEVNVIEVTIIGKGGHGSAPEKANDPIQTAIDFHLKFREMNKLYREQNKQFVCTLPMFHVKNQNLKIGRGKIKCDSGNSIFKRNNEKFRGWICLRIYQRI
jgi:hypothetical protein